MYVPPNWHPTLIFCFEPLSFTPYPFCSSAFPFICTYEPGFHLFILNDSELSVSVNHSKLLTHTTPLLKLRNFPFSSMEELVILFSLLWSVTIKWSNFLSLIFLSIMTITSQNERVLSFSKIFIWIPFFFDDNYVCHLNTVVKKNPQSQWQAILVGRYNSPTLYNFFYHFPVACIYTLYIT